MFDFVTPSTIFRTQIQALRSNLPGVLDGQAVSVHDARIATRRVRELLPLLGDQRRRDLDDLRRRFKRLGRSLGRVRDADVQITLLESLETHIPHSAPLLVVLRQERERQRLELLRKLIKRLERLEAVRLVDSLLDARHHWRSAFAGGSRPVRRWKHDLRRTLADRAVAASEAIEHATGVYFPGRAHEARIAIKKLRYAVEIAHETGRGDRSAAIRELKKAQDLLGDLHDRQELIDDLLKTAGDQANGHSETSLVTQVIDAECHQLHQKYLSRRESLIEICRFERANKDRRDSFIPQLATAGALVLGSGALAFSQYSRRHS
jgi:CHAD domain-containing protein